MKRWLLIGGAVVVVGLIVVANLGKSDLPTVTAKTAKVERGSLTSSISAPGQVRAVSSVDVSAEVPGRIVALNVAEGDSVAAGDVLLRLDDDQYKSRVEQAQAAVKSAAANLTLSEAHLEKYKKDRERLQALADQNLASAQALEDAVTNVTVQEADVDARRQDVARSRAALLDAEDNLDKTVYRAPVSGIVSRLNVEAGEIVITGTMNNPGTVILTVADLSDMEVEAEVDETDVVDVRPGQKASISVDAFPDTTFEGTVSSVGNSGRRQGAGGVNEVINFEVDVRFNTADRRLKPGMTADVEVETKTRKDVLTVPIQSLVARSRGTLEKDRKEAARREKTEAPADTAVADTLKGEAREAREKEVLEGVYTVVDDRAVFVPVTTGIADESRIEVTGKLGEGDVVVSGPYRVLRDLKEGTKVKVETSGSEAS